MKKLVTLLILAGCAHRAQEEPKPIVSMQIVDRNGFSETISAKERLTAHQKTDFTTPQPYKKILRVFGRNKKGKSSSTITTYHDNGQLNELLEVTDGRAHGIYQEFFSNGQLKIDGSVIEGMAEISDLAKASWHFDGKTSVFSENGKPVAEIYYDRGVLHGTSVYYHPDGTLAKSIPYNQDEIDGIYQEFTPSGVLSKQAFYVKDKKEGRAEGFWTNTQLAFFEEYQKGSLIQAKYYHLNGTETSQINEGNGAQTIFQENGTWITIEYQHGLPEGIVHHFDSSGMLEFSYHVKEGKKQGEEIQYYPLKLTQGVLQPKLSLFWQDDAVQGMVKTWYKDGTAESQKEMDHNKKNGLSFAWYPNGDLMLMEEYQQDNLVRGTYYQRGDRTPVSKVENGNGLVTLYTPEGLFLKKITYEKGTPL